MSQTENLRLDAARVVVGLRFFVLRGISRQDRDREDESADDEKHEKIDGVVLQRVNVPYFRVIDHFFGRCEPRELAKDKILR